MGDAVDAAVRVRYAETDQMGVVYYANYLVWFEIGRTEFLRQRGVGYREMEASGCFAVVGEVTCRYHAPARYDDLLTIRTRVSSVQSRLMTFSYEVLSEDGQRIATGETTHVITDAEGKPRRLPDHYKEALLRSS